MRYRRGLVTAAIATAALAVAATSPAYGDPGDRACFGEFASEFAQANPQSGQIVSRLAQQGGSGFGLNVSQLAQCP